LEEAGHQLYGLWIQRPPFSFNAVGPVPFGHIEDIPFDYWEQRIREIQPDVIYALLNFPVVPLACQVLKKNPDIPFVWHFKEGPSVCLNNGLWNDLIYLYTFADGKIYLNQTVKDYYDQFTPSGQLTYILDGDLPKQDYFHKPFSKRLSESDGDIHTLVAGRMIGINHIYMNIPARINTYMAAGLPVIQRDNTGHIVATQQRIEELNIGILFNRYDDLAERLKDKATMEQLRANVMEHRLLFSFDYHVPELIAFFRKVIEHKKGKQNGKDASKNS
jgi:glycosyltransferase involved in cell wall biosynthesis